MGAVYIPHRTARPAAVAQKPAVAAAGPGRRTSVVLAFLPTRSGAERLPGEPAGADAQFESELASVPGVSVGIMSATQGAYVTEQFLLDVTQGARIASSAYPTPRPPALSLQAIGSGAAVSGWSAARRRAEDAPQLLRPGLLASQIPGGAAYAGITGEEDIDAMAGAGRAGQVAEVSSGRASTLLSRVAVLNRRRALLVVDLPGGLQGYGDLRALAAGRGAGELLIVVQRPAQGSGGELLWVGATGLPGEGGRELSSQTTNERGLIASVDIAPTILDHLGLRPIPPDMRGDPIRTDGELHSASLRALEARLRVVGGRRLEALGFLLGAWVLLLLGCARWRPARAWAMRVGALAVLWAPVAVLIAAAFEQSRAVEFATITLACLALGALTDLLLAWPRAPLAPAVVAVVAIVVDALAHTQLLMRSLLGPNPILGARFYGVGNELKSGLAVLVLAAVAGALYPLAQSAGAQGSERRRGAIAMAGAGMLLAVLEGSARVGAGVGGVILVCAAFAVATVMLLPGAVTRRRALIVFVSPIVGLAALALLDLATAHGSGHYTGSILHARSAGDLRDVIVRRYTAAWDELRNHAMPYATAVALAYAVVAYRRRERLLAPVDGDPVWQAVFAGGLTAGVVGALVEDSGPVLLVVAVFVLGCVASYLWGGDVTRCSRARPVGRSESARGPRAAARRSAGAGRTPAR
jgi:hypothetical protein